MIFGILGAIQNLGMPYHVIRQDRPLYGAFLATGFGTGCGLALLLFLGADLFSFFSPELPYALRILAVILPINALANVPVQYLNRELRIERLVVVEAIGNLTFLAGAGALAYWGANLYCLVWAHAISLAAKALVLWIIVRKEIPLSLARGDIGLLVRGSSRLFFLGLLGILFHQADTGVAGTFLSIRDVGYWNMAMAIVLLPVNFLEAGFSQVLFPLFSRFKEDPAKIIRAYRASTFFIMGIEVPLYAFLFVHFPRLTVWILGPQWAVAGDLAQLLCFYCILDPFSVFGHIMVLAKGKDWPLISWQACSVLGMVLFGLWLAPSFQLLGMTIARYAVFFGSPFVIAALVREIGSRNVFPPALALLYLSFPLIVWLGSISDSPGLKLALTSAAALLVMAVMVWRLAPTAREFLQPVWQKYSQAPRPEP